MNLSDPSLEASIFSERFVQRYTRTIVVATCCVIAAHIVFVDLFPNFSYTLYRQFDLAAKGFFVQWVRDFVIYSTAGVIAWVVAWLFYAHTKIADRRTVLSWILVGCAFIYIGMYNNSFVHTILLDGISSLIAKTNLPNTLLQLRPAISVILLRLPGMIAILFMLGFFRANLLQYRPAQQLALLAVFLYVASTAGEIGGIAATSFAGAQVGLVISSAATLFAGIVWTVSFLHYGIHMLREMDMAR